MTKEEFLNDPHATFDFNTPYELKIDRECVIHSIHNNINSYFYISIKYMQENKDIRAYIAQEAIRQKHILMSDDISEIKGNFEIIKYSIQKKPSLIDSASLYDITEEQEKILTDILLEKGYTINKYTNPYLFNFRRLIYNLLLEDPNCVKYFKTSLLEDKEYFEYIKKAILSSNKEFILEPSTGDITTNIIYSDFDLIKLSTENDCNSIENCNINNLNNRQLNEIIEILIRNHYVINTKTNYRLKQHKILQESSFLIKPDSIKYMVLTDNQDLLFRGINHGLITRDTFEELRLFIERTPNKTLCHAIAKIYNLSDETIEFFDKFMEKDHPISLLKPIVDQTAITSWNAYRNNNTMLYNNLFLRTITELPRAKSVKDFINYYYPFDQMCRLVGRVRVLTAFDNFYEASKNHTLTSNEINEISTICSLFISKAKDEYISTETDMILKTFYPFYTLNENNPIVHKKLYEQKRIMLFIDDVKKRKPYTRDIVNEIIGKYLKIANNEFPNRKNLEFINDIYNAFLEQEEPLIVEPLRYKEFLLKTELDKLIIRLNKGNIKIDSLECKNYLKYIKFDKKFYVDEIKFTEEELLSFKEYVTKTMISKKMIGEFVRESKKHNENIIISSEEIDSLREVLPFIDEYFIYKPDPLQKINIKELMEVLEAYNKTIKNLTKEQIEVLNRLLLDQDLLYYASNDNYTYVTNSNVLIDLIGLKTVINGFNKLFTIMRKEDIKASNINLIIKNIKILRNITDKQYYVIGKEMIELIISNNTYTYGFTDHEKLKVTGELYARSVTKNRFTVPRINGKNGLFNYEIMDQLDPDLYTCGIKTDACFRPCGNDNDFLHYCCLDKNGFVIKITDQEGNLVGRAAGFRSGNGIYLNQLRSIHDGKDLTPSGVKNGLIDTLKKCCDKLLKQLNEDGQKVDFIIATDGYNLSGLPENYFGYSLGYGAANKLNNTPIDTSTQDYKEFLENPNLIENYDVFTTDYKGLSGLIVISSNKEVIEREDIKFYDVNPIYTRERNKVIETIINESNIDIINKIRAINCLLNNLDFNRLDDYLGYNLVLGDNWYIIYKDNEIIDTIALDGISMLERDNAILNINSTKRIK